MIRHPDVTRAVLSFLALPVLLGFVTCARSPAAPEPGAGAATAGHAVSSQALPWRMDATVLTTPAEPPEGLACVAYFTSVVDGAATHAGAFSGVGSTCATGQIAPDPDPPFVPTGPPPYATFQFYNPRWTLTTANGDEVWIENVDAVFVVSLVDGSSRGAATQRIIGGTGRFAGAAGAGTASSVDEAFHSEGWIRFR